MSEVGAYEAKTHMSRLLERVARGEQITITRHGVPVALLSPATGIRKPVAQVIEELRNFRSAHKLGGLSLREMMEEGRR